MPCVSKPRLSSLCAALYVAMAASLAGCKSGSEIHLPGVTPYRMEIQQGNYVSQDMLSKLKKGMSREQVRFVLGTPLVADMFHANRWDYVFYREIPRKPREERRISVFFENDRLARVEGDVVPEGQASKPQAGTEAAKPQAETESGAAKPQAAPPQGTRTADNGG